MNIQKTVSTLIVALFTAVSIQSVAFAKAKDDDSVRSWGPWATLVQPAAGPQVANVALAGLGLPSVDPDILTGPPVIPPPVTPPPVAAGSCDAGAACRYAVIGQEQFQLGFIDNRIQERTTVQGPQLATPSLDPRPVGLVDGPLNNGGPDELITLTVDSNSTPLSYNLTDQGVFVSPDFGGLTFWGFYDYDASAGPDGYPDELQITGVTLDVGTLFAYGTVFERKNIAEPDDPFLFEYRETETAFIVGETSSLVGVAAAEAAATDVSTGTSVANYSGFTLLSGTNVDIEVDFGNDTFIATVNGGIDGSVSEQLNSDTSISLIGEVGFVASGDIIGVNIVANNISATDASAISGDFIGSFFGDEAGVLAGTTDIDKTTEAVSGNYTDAYVTAVESQPLPELGGE